MRSGKTETTFEHINMYPSLLQVPGMTVDYFKLDRLREIGPEAMGREIGEYVAKTKPDILLFSVPHVFDKEVFRAITRDTQTATIGIFSDDDTDFYRHSLAWSGVLDWIVTFYPPALEEYRRRGVNIIGINWAANPDFWKAATAIKEKNIDVSFIGAAKDERVTFVKKMARHGVDVTCFGAGWPNGSISFEKMTEVIGASKINLNIGIGKPIWRPRTLARVFISPRDGGKEFYFDPRHVKENVKTIMNRRRPMSRARPYELSAAGAFVLTNRSAPVFGEPYREGKEMVSYTDARDAAEKARYYLAPEHAAEREAIAHAGYERTLHGQSFKKRFTDILTLVAKDPKPKTPGVHVLA